MRASYHCNNETKSQLTLQGIHESEMLVMIMKHKPMNETKVKKLVAIYYENYNGERQSIHLDEETIKKINTLMEITNVND